MRGLRSFKAVYLSRLGISNARVWSRISAASPGGIDTNICGSLLRVDAMLGGELRVFWKGCFVLTEVGSKLTYTIYPATNSTFLCLQTVVDNSGESFFTCPECSKS
ncbi:hypothetical protein N7G274_007516 [Stereocaulon virgatum]|uniref:LAGLIDADG homing endonuclease n=1 Tax=Stereocaulon virgatum TaxID=373712 RepID=A0ABR4A137_9LECA